MKVFQLIFLYAEHSDFWFFKFSIDSFVTDEQSSFTIQNSNVSHFASTIDKILDRVFMLVQFFVVLSFDWMMYAIIVFAKIVFRIAKIRHDDETLTKRVILKSFNSFFWNFELFIVSREFQMNEKYEVNDFLYCRNKTEIESEMKNSNDHDDDNIHLKWKQRNQQLQQ